MFDDRLLKSPSEQYHFQIEPHTLKFNCISSAHQGSYHLKLMKGLKVHDTLKKTFEVDG